MVKVEFDKQSIIRVQKYLQGIAQGPARLKFFSRLGAAVLRWVDENFRTDGGLAGGWKPLRPLTLFGKRAGASHPLETLRNTFTSQATEVDVRVGTARRGPGGVPIPAFHQFGTRGPYEIRPKKPGGALAFAAPPGFGGGGYVVRTRPYGTPEVGMVTAQAVRATRGGAKIPSGVTVGPGGKPTKTGLQGFVVLRKVIHPGLPPRPMLPTAEQIIPTVEDVWQDFVQEYRTTPVR